VGPRGGIILMGRKDFENMGFKTPKGVIEKKMKHSLTRHSRSTQGRTIRDTILRQKPLHLSAKPVQNIPE